jgi:hypothetical protein
VACILLDSILDGTFDASLTCPRADRKINTVMDELIKQLLGESYCWDEELEELNYRGNPIAYWITDYEVRMVDLAKSILNKAA